MLTSALILAATNLASVAHGATLPRTVAKAAVTVLDPVPDLSAGPPRNISARTTENPAVTWTEFESRRCDGWAVAYQVPDGGCFLLPTGDGFKVDWIADTCRVFVDSSKSCNGAGFQVYPGQCYDVHDMYSIKAFCH
ncbi:hypothetical protein C8A00DRAFT_34305 [Chaetomidium leptoderma]|uniref:Uncharacterized protein n=1 Tax=Chaetomidium leptoderma TaxID=669021 RepID=A0AAN6VK13_9PEZI|nr:hypothetical protein C8A00DRAFT_34305 [Chaetomidium leptoderma]